jgi:hypothetical protein
VTTVRMLINGEMVDHVPFSQLQDWEKCHGYSKPWQLMQAGWRGDRPGQLAGNKHRYNGYEPGDGY